MNKIRNLDKQLAKATKLQRDLKMALIENEQKQQDQDDMASGRKSAQTPSKQSARGQTATDGKKKPPQSGKPMTRAQKAAAAEKSLAGGGNEDNEGTFLTDVMFKGKAPTNTKPKGFQRPSSSQRAGTVTKNKK